MEINCKCHHLNHQQGFSLIEVLTALLVLGIGLLGQMTMQMTSLSSNQSSSYRSQAAILANDISDRMRLNETAVDNGKYDAIDTSSTTLTVPSCYTSSNGCSASDQAQLDLYQWKESLEALIPSGKGIVVKNSTITTANVFTITITWSVSEKLGLTNASNNSLSMDIGV